MGIGLVRTLRRRKLSCNRIALSMSHDAFEFHLKRGMIYALGRCMYASCALHVCKMHKSILARSCWLANTHDYTHECIRTCIHVLLAPHKQICSAHAIIRHDNIYIYIYIYIYRFGQRTPFCIFRICLILEELLASVIVN
jgi:hypothetical protein